MTVPRWACPCGASGGEGAVVEARVASMVAHSGAVVARGVPVMMGAEIAALAAVNGGRLAAAAAASTVRE